MHSMKPFNTKLFFQKICRRVLTRLSLFALLLRKMKTIKFQCNCFSKVSGACTQSRRVDNRCIHNGICFIARWLNTAAGTLGFGPSASHWIRPSYSYSNLPQIRRTPLNRTISGTMSQGSAAAQEGAKGWATESCSTCSRLRKSIRSAQSRSSALTPREVRTSKYAAGIPGSRCRDKFETACVCRSENQNGVPFMSVAHCSFQWDHRGLFQSGEATLQTLMSSLT